MPEQDRADDGARRHAAARRRAAGPSRSSGTACARSATPSRAACACTRATCSTSRRAIPSSARLNRALSHHRAVLDGEVVALDADGRPSFGALQRRMHVGSETRGPAPGQGGAGHLRHLRPAVARRPLAHGPALHRAPRAPGRARARRRRALAGARLRRRPRRSSCSPPPRSRASRASSPSAWTRPTSRGGARACWLKVKNTARQEVVIGGWVPGDGKRRDRIGALLVGRARRRRQRCATSGASAPASPRPSSTAWPSCCARSSATTRRSRPAARRSRAARSSPSPELVAEVEFREWTDGGQLRAPSYKGLRDDKPAELVVREEANAVVAEVDGRQVKLSNLDKVLYPEAGFAKRDVIDYYARVAPAVLPHLEGRALTLKRYPNGVDAAVLLREERAVAPPRLGAPTRARGQRSTTSSSTTRRRSCGWPTSPTSSCTPRWRSPTSPSARRSSPSTSTRARRPRSSSAAASRELLRGHVRGPGAASASPRPRGRRGCRSTCRSTARRPSRRPRRFSKAVAELLAREEPELVVARQTKSARAGKVLVDWGQNDVNKTTVSVYSLRAMRAPDGVDAGHVGRGPRDAGARGPRPSRRADVLRRVDEHGDLFAPVLTLVQRLPGA